MENIFKWFTEEGGSPKANVYVYWFVRQFSPKNFNGIDRLLMCFLCYCAKLSITPCRKWLEAYLKVDGKQDIKQHNIKVETMTTLDYRETSQLEEAYQILKDVALFTYDEYLKVDKSEASFKVDIYNFMHQQRADNIQKLMMDAYPHLNDGSDINEVSMKLRNNLAELDTTYDLRKISDVDYSDGIEDKMEFIAKTGMPCIDGDVGGIYTTLIYTVNAQPGAGKTRFACAHFAYRVLVEAKKDVIFYENEMSPSQIRNILIAYHIIRIYGGRVKIPDSLMNKYDEMSDEQKQIYESAKIDLFESGQYGKLIIKEGCVVERLEDECNAIMQTNNVGLLVIDYMGLCESDPEDKWAKHKAPFEVITDAYIATRHIVRAYNIAAVCINQYNDSGIEAAYAGKQIRSGHVQGGHIVQRHTDYDLSMTFTEEQELANVRMLSVTKKRGAKGFKNVMLQVDLSVSIFRQEASIQVADKKG